MMIPPTLQIIWASPELYLTAHVSSVLGAFRNTKTAILHLQVLDYDENVGFTGRRGRLIQKIVADTSQLAMQSLDTSFELSPVSVGLRVLCQRALQTPLIYLHA